MIKKVIKIEKNIEANDKVELGWFDMQKPNLTAVSEKGVEFIIIVKFGHLHISDILECEDGYTIEVKKAQDRLYELSFKDSLTFAKTAYEIGNRHQPINIEENKITILDDISIDDIIKTSKANENIDVKEIEGYFQPNGKAHHSH
jgi:urease accessory protein